MARQQLGPRTVRVDRLASLSDAATRSDTPKMTLWHWVEAGMLPFVKIGNATVVCLDDIPEIKSEMSQRRVGIGSS